MKPWDDWVEYDKPSKQMPAYKAKRVKRIKHPRIQCESCEKLTENRIVVGEIAKNGKTFKYLCKACGLWQDPITKQFSIQYGYQVEEVLRKKR